MTRPFVDPGEQTGSGTKRESQRCPETVDMFAPIDAVREERRKLSDARFDGDDYSHERDHTRLTGQIQRVHDLIFDGEWRTLNDIADATGDPHSSVSAQLRNLRKERFGGHNIEREYIGAGLYSYRLREKLT
jgi:hypothetical protein